MKLILASMKDLAARNIAERLIENHEFERSPSQKNAYARGDITLLNIEGETTKLLELPAKAEEIIVASRHASESGRQSLTVHAPGFLDNGELAISSPPTIKAALKELAALQDEFAPDYQVSLEATHHGPTHFNVPVTFVEIGSLPEQWEDRKAGEAAASAIMVAAEGGTDCRRALAIGGIHYAPLHTEVVLKTDIGTGHIIPKYAATNEALIEKAIARTAGKVEVLLLDRKGATADQRETCKIISEKLGLEVVRAGGLG